MASNATIDQDTVLTQVAALAVATFAVVTLAGGATKRLQTAIVANMGTNKCIKDESGNVMCLTTASGAYPVIMAEQGLARIELEKAAAPGY